MLDQIRVEGFDQEWKDNLADAVAFDGSIGVGGILAPFFAISTQVILKFGITTAEQRANEVDIADEAFAFHSAKRGAFEFHQKGLGYIIHVMSSCDGVELQRGGAFRKEVESDSASGHFD